jgi:hypothetical protein
MEADEAENGVADETVLEAAADPDELERLVAPAQTLEGDMLDRQRELAHAEASLARAKAAGKSGRRLKRCRKRAKTARMRLAGTRTAYRRVEAQCVAAQELARWVE